MPKRILLSLLLLLVFGFPLDRTPPPRPYGIIFSVSQWGNTTPVITILDNPNNLAISLEKIEPGFFLVHYDTSLCAFKHSYLISNNGNVVDAPPQRSFSFGHWACGSAVLLVMDENDLYTDGFWATLEMTIYPGAPVVP